MTRKIKIAQVLETIHLGGVEQRVRTIVRGLDPDRYEHLVICTQAKGIIPEQMTEAGARIVEVGVFRKKVDPRVIGRAYGAIREFRPDIVHGGVFEGVIMGVTAGRLTGVPVVISEETSDAFGRRATGHLFAKALYRLSDCTIAVSPFVERYLIDELKLPAGKVRMIANAVVAPPQRPSAGSDATRSRFGIPESTFLFGTLGRLLDAHKGISDAIRALAALDHDSRTDLMIVGIGPDFDEHMLRGIAASLGVADRVHFAGYQSDPYPLLQAMDVFLHPARYEAFGMVIAEAMFAGLPVIATRVGGIPDVVDEGVTALLVEPRNVSALSRAMARMVGNEALRRRFGEAGLARSTARFSEARYLAEIEELYRALLERAR